MSQIYLPASGHWIFHAVRPTVHGLEAHLASISRLIAEFRTDVAVVDPITSFANGAGPDDIKIMLMRMVDMYKCNGITAMFTSLTVGSATPEETSLGVSSLVDSWLLLRNPEVAGERTRGLYVLKSRAMAHSNQIRELRLGDDGIFLAEVEIDSAGKVLVGAARLLDAMPEQADGSLHEAEVQRRRALLEDRRRLMEARIAAMRAAFEGELHSLECDLAMEERRMQIRTQDRNELAASRQGTP